MVQQFGVNQGTIMPQKKVIVEIMPNAYCSIHTGEGTAVVLKAGTQTRVEFDNEVAFENAKRFNLFKVLEVVADKGAAVVDAKPTLVAANKVVDTPAKDDSVLDVNTKVELVSPVSPIEQAAVSDENAIEDTAEEAPVETVEENVIPVAVVNGTPKLAPRYDLEFKILQDGEVLASFDTARKAKIFYNKAAKKFPVDTLTAVPADILN